MSFKQPTLSCLDIVKRRNKVKEEENPDKKIEKKDFYYNPEIFESLKKQFVEKIKYYLDMAEFTYGRENKIILSKKMFEYMDQEDFKNIMLRSDVHKKFSVTVQNKLIEFYIFEHVMESKIWYKNLFGTEIPSSYIKTFD